MALCATFIVFILLFRLLNSTSVIDAIYIMCSYTYGPLLGLFTFALVMRRRLVDRWVPVVAVLSPCVCFVLDCLTQRFFDYRFGYELLMLNGLLTFVGLSLISRSRYIPKPACR